jgi:hypothetical protein
VTLRELDRAGVEAAPKRVRSIGRRKIARACRSGPGSFVALAQAPPAASP